MTDELRDISPEEYDELVKKACEYRETLRENYNWYDAVFEVDMVNEGAGIVNIRGRVLYGSFNFQDKIKIISGGNIREYKVDYAGGHKGLTVREAKQQLEHKRRYSTLR